MNEISTKRQFSQFQWFCLGFAIAFVASAIWPLALYIECRGCSDHFDRWLKHHQTYTTAHHFFFAPAVGVFLATFSLHILRTTKLWQGIFYCLLLGLTLYIVYEDFIDGHLQSYQTQSACKRLGIEKTLRDEHELLKQQRRSLLETPNQETDDFETKWLNHSKDQLAYKNRTASYLVDQNVKSIADVRAKGNVVAWVSFALSLFYAVFIVSFIWYAGVAAANRVLGRTTHLRLAVVAFLLIPWIPLRVYTDHYQNDFLFPNATAPASVFAFLVAIVVMVFFAMSAVPYYGTEEKRRDFAKFVGGGISSFVALILVVIPKWAPGLQERLSALKTPLILALATLSIFLIIALARMYLVPNRINTTR